MVFRTTKTCKMKITDKYVFFYGSIYSQWYLIDMVINDIKYNCCEQYMMHQKAILFGDFDTADKIMKCLDPKEQKRLGRTVKNFIRDVWENEKFQVLYEGNHAKFSQNKELLDEMLKTDKKIFVEASPFDRLCGIGLRENDENVNDPFNWKGQNLLGFALTLVKHELR